MQVCKSKTCLNFATGPIGRHATRVLEHDASSLVLLSPLVTPLTRKRADASDPTAANAKST